MMRETNVRTKRNQTVLIFWSVVAGVLALVFILLSCIPDLRSNFHLLFPTNNCLYYEDSAKYQIGAGRCHDVKSVEIEWVDGAVRVLPGTQESGVRFEEDSDVKDSGAMLHWYLDDAGTLRLKYSASGYRFLIGMQKTLTVYTPARSDMKGLSIKVISSDVAVSEETLETLSLDTVSGQINLHDVSVTSACGVKTVSGNVGAQNLCAQSLDFNGVSGQLMLTDAAIPQAYISSVSGNIHLSFSEEARPQILRADTTSGDANLRLPAACGFEVQFESMSGNFSSDFPTMKNNKLYTYRDGTCKMQFHSVSGDLYIAKR